MDGSSPLPEIIRTTSANLTLRFDLDHLSSTWSRLRSTPTPGSSLSSTPSTSLNVQATANVMNADDTVGAERELARVIQKEDFSTMGILGQFNLGFIITRRFTPLRRDAADDLFIVDQHAADEKYNFETLQQTTKIESQKLFQPRALELTAADELLAIENIDVLHRNGFELIINDDTHPGHGERVKLVAQPVSKGTTFDMKDLEELLHLMQDQPRGQMVRCSKARAMFAMRACRKSVMVGMPLTIGQMTSVVRHMGTMEQPWNCPHGRPTMRHLMSLSDWDRDYEKSSHKVDWSTFAL
ncbi:hypothetical protein K439DRAFT_1365464 [Ramaria rubella]|nr:hypothetical protein K439DRAFT_1365464 [Ramaria rubella]